MSYLIFKFVHVIGAAVLLGTGAGIAFFMLRAHFTRKATVIAQVARIVVIADFIFTAPAVILQPITGGILAGRTGIPLTHGWLLLSILLYLVTGAFWLPVVWMQVRMQRLANEAATRDAPLPRAYNTIFWLWFAFGFPAFASVLGIFWLMIAKPAFE
jgi:uncharacterized membrane protein